MSDHHDSSSGDDHGTRIQIGDVYGGVRPDVPFQDRVDVLERLDTWLAEAENGIGGRFWMVTGPPGYGVTTTVRKWIDDHVDRFPHAQILVDCGGGSGRGFGRGAEEVCDRYFALKGVETDGRGLDTPAAKAEFFLSLVEDQRAVLLLDDVRTAAQVTPFLTGASGLLVIVTAAGPVQRLARYRPRSLALKRMADTDLAALITGVLQDDDRCADTGAVTELAGHCLGLPLVARHAAGLLAARPDIPVRGLARRMAEHGRLGALEDGQGEAMPVPDDPSGVFEAHYRELDPRAAELYLGLGLHPTPDFDRWCGHAILHGHPRDEADAALRTLLARGLVQQGRPGRYAMHDLAHEHAARTAQRELPPARRRRISRRIADHYLYAAVAADRRLSQRWRVGPLYQAPAPYRLPDFAETDPAEWLGDSLDAIAACMEDAAGIRDPHPGYCWQMGEATNAYFTAHGRTDVRTTLLALAEQDAERCEEHDALARIRAQQGEMMLGRGRLDEADARFRLSLAAAERGTDPRGRGAALEWLGITRRKKGDGAAAIGFLDRSLPFLDATRARPFALHHMHKGDAYRVMGEDEAALAQYATALHFFAEHARTDRRDEANEGKVRLRRASLLPPGDRAEAVALITEALGLFRAAGRPYQQAKALEALGDADAGERADRSPWDEALKLFEEYRYPEDAARVRAKIAGGSSG